MAETAAEYMKKGQLVYVEGRLQTRSWEDKDNVKRYTTEILCDNFTMLGRKGDDTGASSTAKVSEQDDDLPF
jgi:single-strand DNA-binding protein